MAFVPTVLTQIFGHLCTGGTIYIPQDRSLDRVFQQIIDQNITYVYIPTPWLPGFFDLSENDSRILCSGLTAVMHAGSSVSSEVLARALAIFGSVFVEAWGMTETCGMPITAYVPDDLLVHQAQYLAETVGRNLPGMQVRVDGSISGVKSEGELLISGSSCFDGYWEDGKVTQRDTWFGTGDIGIIDESGLVRLTGRLKELIISGGANVSPLEVEDCVLQCEGVIDAAVFGIDDAYWGEAVCLVIVASDPSDQTLISRIDLHCRSRLARYKVPKKILVVNDLPRTASQKLKRVEIKEKFMLEVVSQLSEHGGQV
jgi:long-chain acyl-CoA synthetase